METRELADESHRIRMVGCAAPRNGVFPEPLCASIAACMPVRQRRATRPARPLVDQLVYCGLCSSPVHTSSSPTSADMARRRGRDMGTEHGPSRRMHADCAWGCGGCGPGPQGRASRGEAIPATRRPQAQGDPSASGLGQGAATAANCKVTSAARHKRRMSSAVTLLSSASVFTRTCDSHRHLPHSLLPVHPTHAITDHTSHTRRRRTSRRNQHAQHASTPPALDIACLHVTLLSTVL
jgi:hypothetical protein